MNEIRALVVYYSRSGNTRAVAGEIAAALGGAKIEEIHDTVNRTGLLGYWRSFREAVGKRTTPLAASGRDIDGYDLVVVGGPVWVGQPSSPIRSWLRAHAAELNSVAFFLTHGGSARDRVFAEMTAESGISPLALLSVRERELGTPEAAAKIRSFAEVLKSEMAPVTA